MSHDTGHIEREWIAVSPDGLQQELLLRVGHPTIGPAGDWVCDVSLGVLDSRQFEVHGSDSWQAMEEGMKHAAVLVHHYEQQGWRFLWARGGERASPSDLARGTVRF